ncbi:mis18-binding protein 1-like [Dendronephthya gigantea]|uniref:mis18-binding protein 1-like n=1 Tax=Dendronephthya gigantea TaxID=151771 RepID=UPI00106D8E96|nr:mis18-binding protein 1-like [Dendronephthya gigantea]
MDWAPEDPSKTDSTDSRTSNLSRKKNSKSVSFLKTALLRGESQSDGSSVDTDSVVRKPKESTRRKKPLKQRTQYMGNLRSENESEKQTESDADDSVNISSSPERSKSKRTKKVRRSPETQSGTNLTTRRKNKLEKKYPSKTSTRVEEATDSDNPDVVQEIDLDSFDDSERQKIVKSSSRTIFLRPARGRFIARNKTNGEFVKPVKSKSDRRTLLKQPIKESQQQNSKKLKVQTGKLASKTGTLARKRELRDMLEQQDEGYEDDAFEGTPFRSHKHSRMHEVSPIRIDHSDDVFDETSDSDIKTPSSRTPTNRLRPAGPLSTVRSDVDNMTPGLLNTVNRDNVDRYVNQLKRQKLRNKHKKVDVSRTPLTKKSVNDNMTEGVEYSFNIHKLTTIEDEEDKDFYWSDNE